MPRASSAIICTASFLALFAPLGGCAQDEPSPVETESLASVEKAQTTPPGHMPTPEELSNGDKRIMGVLPNYKTVPDASLEYEPISVHQKFYIATHDSFDLPMFGLAGMYAGLAQISGQYPSWGQGLKGYSKRYLAAFADQGISNYLTEAILPSVLHQDPRYFRLGQGNALHRVTHALSWVVVARSDAGHNVFNASEIFGSGLSAAAGLAYYPSAERTGAAVATRFTTQIGFDAMSSVLKEYWPDIRKKLFHK